jgi:DNA-binding MarR family transcriptional regulator
MPSAFQIDEEQRGRWIAFIQTIHPGSDPQAIRLMDELRMVAHQLYQLNETNLEATGLSYAQYRVLMSLYFCEWTGRCEGLNPSEISIRQGTSRNTISALIRGLEDEQLVERHLDSDDRRRFNIRLTDAGRRMILEHSSHFIQTVDELFAALSPQEIETLSFLLQTLNRRARAMKEKASATHQRGLHAINE